MAVVLGANELTTSQNGRVTIGVAVSAIGGWNPAAVVINGVTAGFTSTDTGRSLALFTFDNSGPYILEMERD